MEDSNTKILQPKSLTHFFYKSLSSLNKKSICPLPEEMILYSSHALDKYAYIDSSSNDALGLNLLQAQSLELDQRVKVYKDVGDRLLVKLGFFSESCNSKLVNKSYYLQLTQMAYRNLDGGCNFYEIPHFYKRLSSSIEHLVKFVATFKEYSAQESLEKYLLSTEVENNHFLALR